MKQPLKSVTMTKKASLLELPPLPQVLQWQDKGHLPSVLVHVLPWRVHVTAKGLWQFSEYCDNI